MASRTNVVNLGRSDVPWTDLGGGGYKPQVLASITANGQSGVIDVSGFKTFELEIIESGGGTATLTIQGSLDGAHFHNLVTAPLDGATTITYTATVSVTANQSILYTLRDPVPLLRVSTASLAGGAVIAVNLYALPD